MDDFQSLYDLARFWAHTNESHMTKIRGGSKNFGRDGWMEGLVIIVRGLVAAGECPYLVMGSIWGGRTHAQVYIFFFFERGGVGVGDLKRNTLMVHSLCFANLRGCTSTMP